ncbi:cysteine hydrolase [Roseateles toxinivorans]|uniref:Nicotinamidase-related amidase n=1 Tax=Roseateles toxinivorans TaxID=270368 RepID=A0A4R6QUC3_9BURK|nr:cysteine hydrolase [Roseateles toxinivorans]TDP74926.1 nicotinamidase-related amidase [Roseateles toxinivorans]
MSLAKNTHLLIIDAQNDFCDLPEAWLPPDPVQGGLLRPALPVPGAHGDMQRLAHLIRAAGDAIAEITITLDSHHRIDIAHPAFWAGQVLPFTAITAAQVRAGEFSPRDPSGLPRTLAYLDALEATGRYTLMVWPVHCEIGSWGQAVHADVRAAYNGWEERRLKLVHKVLKGSNPWTEHYSALQAEVPSDGDEGTQLNRDLLARLDSAELLLIAGEASSHCVKATTEHLARHLPGGRLDRLVLLTDCMSPVAGFEAQQQAFFAAMRERGLRLASSAEMLKELSKERA